MLSVPVWDTSSAIRSRESDLSPVWKHSTCWVVTIGRTYICCRDSGTGYTRCSEEGCMTQFENPKRRSIAHGPTLGPPYRVAISPAVGVAVTPIEVERLQADIYLDRLETLRAHSALEHGSRSDQFGEASSAMGAYGVVNALLLVRFQPCQNVRPDEIPSFPNGRLNSPRRRFSASGRSRPLPFPSSVVCTDPSAGTEHSAPGSRLG